MFAKTKFASSLDAVIALACILSAFIAPAANTPAETVASLPVNGNIEGESEPSSELATTTVANNIRSSWNTSEYVLVIFTVLFASFTAYIFTGLPAPSFSAWVWADVLFCPLFSSTVSPSVILATVKFSSEICNICPTNIFDVEVTSKVCSVVESLATLIVVISGLPTSLYI